MEKTLKQRAEELQSQYDRNLASKRERQLKMANALGARTIYLPRYVNSHDIMRLPIFSTKYARNGRQNESIVFVSQNGEVYFEVAGAKGIPSQVDANILRYAISKGRKVRQKVGVMPEQIETSKYELLRILGRNDSKSNYMALEKSLQCLSGMQITGNIFDRDKIFTGSLVSFFYTNKDKRKDTIQIVFNPIFREHLDKEENVLLIPDEILTSTNALKIRLIELVRVGMGTKKQWSIRLSYLRELCVYSREVKYLKRDIKGLDLQYAVSFTKTDDRDQIVLFSLK